MDRGKDNRIILFTIVLWIVHCKVMHFIIIHDKLHTGTIGIALRCRVVNPCSCSTRTIIGGREVKLQSKGRSQCNTVVTCTICRHLLYEAIGSTRVIHIGFDHNTRYTRLTRLLNTIHVVVSKGCTTDSTKTLQRPQ